MSANNKSNVAETLANAFGKSLDGQASYKTMTSWSQNNFSIIAKIVKYLKDRHLKGDTEPITLEDILDETEQTDTVSNRTRNWLENEVLEQNPRVRVIKPEDETQGVAKYQFKPVIDVQDRNGLRKYLMERYQSGAGAVWLDDVNESLPHAHRAIRKLEESKHIVVVTRPVDKKKIIFYNEGNQTNGQEVNLDEDFKKLWRSISVEGVAEDKIEEYLEKHGIQSIQDLASKKTEPTQKRRKVLTRRKNNNFKSHNTHMKDVLEEYPDK